MGQFMGEIQLVNVRESFTSYLTYFVSPAGIDILTGLLFTIFPEGRYF